LIHKCTFMHTVLGGRHCTCSNTCYTYFSLPSLSSLPFHPSLSHSPATKHHSIPELSQQHSQSTGPRCGGYKQHWNSSSSGAHPGHPVEWSRATGELSCQLDSCRHSLQLHHHPGGRLQHWYKSTNGYHRILTLCN